MTFSGKLDSLEFEIKFHGPFLVASGEASMGLDRVGDPARPLPGTTLKGVMRDSAEVVLDGLDVRDELVIDVFGGPSAPSPWSWSDADLVNPKWRERAQVRIDPQSGAADPGGLRLGEDLWADSATFRVIAANPTQSESEVEIHRALLVVAGHAVKSLGSARRRGNGWVTITHRGSPGASEALKTLLERSELAT